MVFDPAAAPAGSDAFRAWYKRQAMWSEAHTYDDPAVSSPILRNWFVAMIQVFPAMNGPFARDDPDDPRITDYCVGRDVIYAGFRWSVANEAYDASRTLAAAHSVGFYNPSNDEFEAYLPDGRGGLVPLM